MGEVNEWQRETSPRIPFSSPELGSDAGLFSQTLILTFSQNRKTHSLWHQPSYFLKQEVPIAVFFAGLKSLHPASVPACHLGDTGARDIFRPPDLCSFAVFQADSPREWPFLP